MNLGHQSPGASSIKRRWHGTLGHCMKLLPERSPRPIQLGQYESDCWMIASISNPTNFAKFTCCSAPQQLFAVPCAEISWIVATASQMPYDGTTDGSQHRTLLNRSDPPLTSMQSISRSMRA